MQPLIITVAITGALPRKKDCPGVPVTPAEQIESTQAAFEAGATIAHIHVRNPDETPSSDPELYAQVQNGIEKYCPGMIVQHSTGGRGRDQTARGAMIPLRPDMASLATGSTNFPQSIYENPPEFIEALAKSMIQYEVKPEIEVFDLAMLYNAANLLKKGLIGPRPHIQFVMGVPNAMPARRSILNFLVSELKDVMPEATWKAAGIGRFQFDVAKWCMEMGGHVRTGLEDNVRFDESRVASSNAELVKKVVDVAGEFQRRPASVHEARELIGGLRQALA